MNLESWTPAGGLPPKIHACSEQSRPLELVYMDKRRIMEPQDVRVHNGSVKLLGYHIRGSSSGRLPLSERQRNHRYWLHVEDTSGAADPLYLRQQMFNLKKRKKSLTC